MTVLNAQANSTHIHNSQGKYKFGVHPDYVEHLADWEAMDDAYEGETRVKEKSNGVLYLPFTPSQLLDGIQTTQLGYKNYEAYKMRATFPDYVTDAVETLVGMLHSKPPVIKVPESMQTIVDECTKAGTSAASLLRLINELQMCPGRCGILVDIDTEENLPYLALYFAEDIPNWEDDQGICDYVVLDESTQVLDRATGNRIQQTKHRICQETDDVYQTATFTDNETYNEGAFVTPTLNGITLSEIPFVFINARDLMPECDRAPLLGLSRLCYTIYRGEADYRQNLFMQGQDTLVIIDTAGGEDSGDTRVGAGAVLRVNVGGDAKYVGVDSQGLPEQRMCLENDRNHARARAGHFIASGQASQESGDALRTRLAALTATLNTVATTGAQGLEKALRYAAQFMGIDPKLVTVTPNTEFFDIQMLGQDLELFMRAISEGAPLSPESVHHTLKKRGLAQFDYKEEVKKRDEQYKPVVATTPSPQPAAPAVIPPTTA